MLLMQPTSRPRTGPHETLVCFPIGALLDTAVETTRLTMKVAHGPRGLPQARPEPNDKWNSRQGNREKPDSREKSMTASPSGPTKTKGMQKLASMLDSVPPLVSSSRAPQRGAGRGTMLRTRTVSRGHGREPCDRK